MPARIRFRALITGKGRHGGPVPTGARSACAALLRQTFSEPVSLPEIAASTPRPSGPPRSIHAYGVS
jgi:hypothetical protein